MICEAFRRFGPESPFDDPFGHVRATARSFLGHTTSWTADGTEEAWTDELDRLWGRVVGYIRIHGVPELYVAPRGYTWWGTYLYANDWKYWTMGSPVEQTILINRTNQEIDGSPLRRPDRWTLETLGATEMLAHLEQQDLVAPHPGPRRRSGKG